MGQSRVRLVETDSSNLYTPPTHFTEGKTDYPNFKTQTCWKPVEVWIVRFDYPKACMRPVQ